MKIDLSSVQNIFSKGVGTPILLVMLLGMMILPLPAFLLDVLFTFNIVFALLVVLATIYCDRPLDFAIFPTVILLTTLMRLALNVASTRVVLLYGHTGTDAAGQVIKSFGEVLIGGNYTVGLVVFSILVIINFVVVTKGAGRVSEVTARFTLDSLPGKQMAIDADLNAGIINQEEAIARREEVAQESDFYGSMDGASKFVRGDAIAGIFILFINIIGGLIIGVSEQGMTLSDAGHNYVLLTVGDGLVAQIPSLLLSTGAAIMVTRVSKSHDMGTAVIKQVFNTQKSLWITASVIAGLGVIPGMPHVSFLSFALLISGLAIWLRRQHLASLKAEEQFQELAEQSAQESARPEELSWHDLSPVDPIGLEVGYRLIPLVDSNQGGKLLTRIKGVRRKLSQELGFLIPSVHIRDNLELNPSHYRITLNGVLLAEEELYPDRLLAINPGQTFGVLDGVKTQDPAFKLEAYWIKQTDKEQAQAFGFTVVDPSTVVATHLSHLLESHASHLLGVDETQALLDKLAESSPKLVKELIPDMLSLSAVTKVLQSLLLEHIPVTDIRTIVESLAENANKTKDPDELLIAVRVALARLITQKISNLNEALSIVTLQPELENLLQNTVQQTGYQGFEPGMAEKIHQSLKGILSSTSPDTPTVLVVQPGIRALLARFVRNISSTIHVLSYQEIPDNKEIRIIGTVG